MKIVAIHLYNHDANITYFDGFNVHYSKIERIRQEKRFHYLPVNVSEIQRDVRDMYIPWNNLDAIIFTCGEYTDNNQESNADWKFNEGEFVKELTKEQFDIAYPFLNANAKHYYRIEHHYAHKLSADFLFGECDGLVIDGVGDYQNHFSIFKDNKRVVNIKLYEMMSIGFLYSKMSKFILGSGSVDTVGKLMGLMSYGKFNERYANQMKHYMLCELPEQLLNPHIIEKYNSDRTPVDQTSAKRQHLDWIHTAQQVLFDKLIEYLKTKFSRDDKFSFTGGVAHNVVFNEILSREFPNVVIPPHVGDEGLSLGAMFHIMKSNGIRAEFPRGQFSNSITQSRPNRDTIEFLVDAIGMGNIVGCFQGHAEIGPRALGNRSLFYRPDLENAPRYFNTRNIKKREWYRPYGIIILEEDLEQYLQTTTKSPYMLHTAQPTKYGHDRLSGVIHADGSVRYQTVSEGWLYEMLSLLKSRTGLSAIVNTSMNLPGKPLVNDRVDAYTYMQSVPIDAMVIENEIYNNAG